MTGRSGSGLLSTLKPALNDVGHYRSRPAHRLAAGCPGEIMVIAPTLHGGSESGDAIRPYATSFVIIPSGCRNDCRVNLSLKCRHQMFGVRWLAVPLHKPAKNSALDSWANRGRLLGHAFIAAVWHQCHKSRWWLTFASRNASDPVDAKRMFVRSGFEFTARRPRKTTSTSVSWIHQPPTMG